MSDEPSPPTKLETFHEHLQFWRSNMHTFRPWQIVAIALTCAPVAATAVSNRPDVLVSSTLKVVEHSVAASPLDPAVLLLSSRRPGQGDCTTWISTDCGQSWSQNSHLEGTCADPRSAIGTSGTTPWYYANYNWNYGVEHFEDVKIVRKDSPTGAWTNPPDSPRTVLDADGGQDQQGGINNSLWVDNYTSNQEKLFVAYQEMLGGRIRGKRSQNQGFTWLSASEDGDYVDDCVYDGWCTGERRNVSVHGGTMSPTDRLYAAYAMAPAKYDPATSIGFRYSETFGQSWLSPTGGDQRIAAVAGLTTIAPKTMTVDTRPCVVVNQATGDVFIAYAARAGTDDGDIFVLKSTNGGATWSSPVRVNQDQTTRDQWNPWMAWDELTGALVIAF